MPKKIIIKKSNPKPKKCTEVTKLKNVNQQQNASSEESNTSWAASGKSDGGDDYIGPDMEDSTEIYEVTTIKEIKEGDFILAEFKGGKRNKSTYKFVCIVQATISDTDKSVMAMNAIDTTHTTFKTNENDVSIISFNAVLGKLPTPRIGISGERVKYIFNIAINVKES